LAVIVCASAAVAEESRKKPVRVYTNEDLQRYSSRRDESTAGEPAVADTPIPERPRERGERYWRQEADRVRERIAALQADADALRARLAALREGSRAAARPAASRRRGEEASAAESEARLRSLEERIRSVQAAFEERARRAGALPGWLR
jgi:hypothetical protein